MSPPSPSPAMPASHRARSSAHGSEPRRRHLQPSLLTPGPCLVPLPLWFRHPAEGLPYTSCSSPSVKAFITVPHSPLPESIHWTHAGLHCWDRGTQGAVQGCPWLRPQLHLLLNK
ncbi:unnamed protein product [Gulo gulo]|uniref:Uncharacterized protein n=1 Tax=Gulo gulo TaxID=48420 RepID=A0A9X9M951_GULGU|nr:unnamed protein product [Gulo gulo]